MEKIKVVCADSSLKLLKKGQEYEAIDNPKLNYYYIKTVKGLTKYNKIRFEKPRLKDHRDFKVGDIIRGLDTNTYGVTNKYAIMKIIDINLNPTDQTINGLANIQVEILTNSNRFGYTGQKYWVVSEWFKYENQETIVDKKEETSIKNFRNQEEILSNITYRYTNNRVYTSFLTTDGNSQTRKECMIVNMTPQGTSFSCGIHYIQGINYLNPSMFKQQFRSVGLPESWITEEVYCDILKNYFKILFDNHKIGFLIFSTNLTSNVPVCERITNALKDFDFVTMSETYNRNSNHKIRFWTCDLYKNQTKK